MQTPSTHLLVIRHGETAWNKESRLQGHIDIQLNDEGLSQAQRLGHALKNESLDVVYASDLQRAIQTAQAIAEHHDLIVQTEPALRERSYGKLEGLTYQDVEDHHPRNFAAWQAREIDFVPEDGESLTQFYSRVTAAVRALVAKHRGQRIAIVAHGGVLDCIYRLATDMALHLPRNFDLKNTSLNRLVWQSDKLRIESWGDVSHLSGKTLDEVDVRVP